MDFGSIKMQLAKIQHDMKEGHKRGNINVAVAVIGGVFMLILMAAIYLLVLGKVQGTMTASSAEYNAVGVGIDAISDGLDLAGVLPIVGMAVAVIGLLAYIALNRGGR